MGTVQAYSMGITLKFKNKFTLNEVNRYNIQLTKSKSNLWMKKQTRRVTFSQDKNTLHKNSLK